MRTTPSLMRPVRRQRAVAALVASVLLVLGAGCSGDDPEVAEPSSSSTPVNEPDGQNHTTSLAPTTEAPETASATTEVETIPDDGVLSVEAATEQLQALMGEYRDAHEEIRAGGTLDERALRALTATFTASAAQRSVDGLESRGGVGIIAADVEVPTVSDVEVLSATETCAHVLATVEGVADLITAPVEIVQPYTARLVRAPEGASGAAWRLDFFSFQPSGQPVPEGACP